MINRRRRIRVWIGGCLWIPFFLLCSGERTNPSLEDIEQAPRVVAADRPMAEVFRPLDGVWRGEFSIYEDPRGQAAGPVRPRDIAALSVPAPGLRKIQTIQVRQEYVSESPYFQRVTIRDTYAGDRTVESRGVNKIQDGKMWCVVKKPDETVVHRGTAPAPGVILWERDLRTPLKIEFFHETVREDAYSIKGWGYYGKDDPDRAPRLWFLGEYRRMK